MRATEFIAAVNLAYEINTDKIGKNPKSRNRFGDYSMLRLPYHSEHVSEVNDTDEITREFAELTARVDVSEFRIYYELSLLQEMEVYDVDKTIIGFNGAQEILYCTEAGRVMSYNTAFETTYPVASSPSHFFDLLFGLVVLKWERIEYNIENGGYDGEVKDRYYRLFRMIAPMLSGEPDVGFFLDGVI